MADETQKPQRTRVPRPDELTEDAFQFISAIDEFKRTNMVSFLTLDHVIEIVDSLGYLRTETPPEPVAELEGAVEAYKDEHDRLFPNWSEIYKIVLQLGYVKRELD